MEEWELAKLNGIPGVVLEDRYVLSKRLGKGAAGEVWVARDRRLDIDVAVKLLHAGHAASPDMLERFTREADLAERMLSPNVVKVLGRGLTRAGIPYIVYERLEGEELSARLAGGKRMSLADARNIIVHLCRGLARAHAVGVLHRDVKPENVFLTKDDRGRLLAKLLDFGVAELVAERKEGDPHTLVGTLEYMAPEVFLDESPASPRSDLYAVGVIAYECCLGRLPRPANSVGELVVALATEKIVSASELRSELPFEIDVWFERALHRDPDERFNSAREMAEALHVVMMDAVQSEGELRAAAKSSLRSPVPFVFEERRGATYSMIPGRADRGSE